MSISIHTRAKQATSQTKPRKFWVKMNDVIAARRQRRALLALEDHLLVDIGLTRDKAAAEGHKSLWNVPNHWRK